MPKIVLTYFDVRARAELSRLILAAGGIQYEDNRIGLPFDEAWKELKPNTPFGSVPILEYDGEVLAQSVTIARFLAKKAGLAGRNELEMAKTDMIVDHTIDLLNNSKSNKIIRFIRKFYIKFG